MHMGQADESALLLRAKGGDKAAYGEIVQRHQTAVFNVAYRLLGRRQDAEDAAQDAFLRGYRAIGRFDPSRPFAPWIKRITVNVCLNRLESEQRKWHLLASEMDGGDNAYLPEENWIGTEPTPEQSLMASERSLQVREAILSLPPRFRAVVELRHFQGLRYHEIAEAIGRPLSSVKSDLFRARKLLAGILRDEADKTEGRGSFKENG
jgi:RNA polymerase sigma-70 factor (ECF subfamily)